MEIKNQEEQTLILDMWDNLSYIDGPAVTEFTYLEGAETPLKLSVIDNDEDKFTPIRAHQLEINFLSTSQTDLSDFTEGPDNRWFTELSFLDPDGTTMHRIFTGFISLSDMQQDFLSEPNVLMLTAYDGLGALKDLPLTDYNDENPKGKYSVLKYLSFALVKTGLYLPINIANSLWANTMIVQGGVDLGWFYTMLDAKTFEDQIGVSVNCYEVLEKLLGEDCTLFQYLGEWYVVRTEEMDGRGLKLWRFSWNGDFISSTARQPYEKDIFSDSPVFLSGERTSVTYERPLASIKETFDYDYPQEIIDNINFERGDRDYLLNPALYGLIEGIDYPTGGSTTGLTTAAFHIDDWGLFRDPAGGMDNSAFIKRVYTGGYETSRYLVISRGSDIFYYVEGNPVNVNQRDKFTFSIDVRYAADISGSGPANMFAASIRLTGLDGSNYSLDDDGKWYLSNSTWTANLHYIRAYGDLSGDQREWDTAKVDSMPIPVSGSLVIWLIHSNRADIREKHFNNLRFDYHAFINSAYADYKGHYFKVGQPVASKDDYRAKKENQVYTADVQVQLFKGALFRLVTVTVPPPGSGFILDIQLTTTWRDNSNTAFTAYKPYGWWQAFSRWNQHLRTMRLFEIQVQGIYGQQFFGLLHLFNLLDDSPDTTNKQFMILHYEIDLYTCEWSAVIAEVIDTTIVKTYSETGNFFEFKYLQ